MIELMTSDGSVVELFEDGTYKALKEGKAKKGTIGEKDENSNKDNEITSPKTGDKTIYIVIAMILACGFFAITFKPKKVRRTRRQN